MITQSPNFKVRINGALALSIPPKRALFGTSENVLDLLEVLWTVFVSAETAELSLSEYRYKATLQEQVSEYRCDFAILFPATMGSICL